MVLNTLLRGLSMCFTGPGDRFNTKVMVKRAEEETPFNVLSFWLHIEQ